MDSAAARLARLRLSVQSDLNALPDQPNPNPNPELESEIDEDTSGGVCLDSSSKQPDTAPSPVPAPPVTFNTPEEEIPQENLERRFVWKQGVTSSYNLGSQPKLAALPIYKLPPVDLKKGETATQKYFTSITALSKYPYLFCNKSCMQDIASAFFDAGKFWTREWDL
jgi:hypothetical protein